MLCWFFSSNAGVSHFDSSRYYWRLSLISVHLFNLFIWLVVLVETFCLDSRIINGDVRQVISYPSDTAGIMKYSTNPHSANRLTTAKSLFAFRRIKNLTNNPLSDQYSVTNFSSVPDWLLCHLVWCLMRKYLWPAKPPAQIKPEMGVDEITALTDFLN